MTSLDKAFGMAVRQRRMDLGISQEELGFIAGVHRTYISQIERGIKSPSLRVIAVLARALDIKVSRLIEMAEQVLSLSMQIDNNDNVHTPRPGNNPQS